MGGYADELRRERTGTTPSAAPATSYSQELKQERLGEPVEPPGAHERSTFEDVTETAARGMLRGIPIAGPYLESREHRGFSRRVKPLVVQTTRVPVKAPPCPVLAGARRFAFLCSELRWHLDVDRLRVDIFQYHYPTRGMREMGPHSLSPPHRVSISFTLPSANWDGTINVRPHVAAIPMVVIDVELEGTHVGSVTLTPDTAHSLGLGLIDVVTRMQGQEGQREQHHGDPGRATDS